MRAIFTALVAFLAYGPTSSAGAAEVVEPPYGSERPGGFEGGKKVVEIEFSFDKEQKECKGDDCNLPGSSVPSSSAPGLPNPGPGTGGIGERSPTSSGVGGAIFGPALGVLSGLIDNALGSGSKAAAIGRAFEKIRAYTTWIQNDYPAAENKIRAEMQTFWSNGIFYSTKQYNTTIADMNTLIDKISHSQLGPDNFINVVIHVPAEGDEIKAVVQDQLSKPMALYDDVNRTVCGAGLCDGGSQGLPQITFNYSPSAYLQSYIALAESSEEPRFEGYLRDTEQKLNEAATAAVKTFANGAFPALNDIGSAAGQEIQIPPHREGNYPPPAGSGPLSRELTNLGTRLASAKAENEREQSAKHVGVSAVANGLMSIRQGDIESAKTYAAIANALLDIALGAIPGVGWARDVYEASTGINLITGQPLAPEERLMAFLGAATGGVSAEPEAVLRAVENVAERESWQVQKAVARVRSFESDTVNEYLRVRYGYEEAAYLPQHRVYRYQAVEEETFARVFTPGRTAKEGKDAGLWVMKRRDIEGLSQPEIAKKFALPGGGGTHIVEVTVPKGTVIERGPTNKHVFGGDPTVSYQYRIPDKRNITYGPEIPIPDRP